MLYCCDDTLLQQPVMFLQFAGICILIFNVRNMKRAEKVVFRIGTVVFRLFANCSVVRILLSIDEKTFFSTYSYNPYFKKVNKRLPWVLVSFLNPLNALCIV